MFLPFAAIHDLLFPPRCLGCAHRLASARPPLLCPDCAADLVVLGSPLCTCCGVPFPGGADHLCGDCLLGSHDFDLARSLLQYRPPISDLILSLKFTGNLTTIATLRELMARWHFMDQFTEPEIVLPVPLHVDRLRQRGFNQAMVLARGCLPQWQKQIAPMVLRRHQPTVPQSSLSGKERRTNLNRAFSVADPARVRDAAVLLVDDVYTTGSTVKACSRALRRAGAKRIEVLTVARSLAG